MSEQNGEGYKRSQEAIKKHRTLIIFAICAFVGTINAIRELRRHDMQDAIVAVVVWFLLAPPISIGFRKLIGTPDD